MIKDMSILTSYTEKKKKCEHSLKPLLQKDNKISLTIWQSLCHLQP